MLVIAAVFVISNLAVIAAENCEVIDGVRQSPINIDPFSTIPEFASPFKWSSGYYQAPESMWLINNGETLKLNAESSLPIVLSGGRLEVPYEFQQVHFHWGDSDGKGSEHRILGYSYPLEMHVVHFQSSSNSSDEFVVVAYFFRISIQTNKALQKLLDVAIQAAENRNENLTVESFPLADLFPTNSFSYYTYKGSLTTPPYTESVTWIIASNALPISKAQLATFRKAAEIDKGLDDNFRCVQDLNGRTVSYITPYN